MVFEYWMKVWDFVYSIYVFNVNFFFNVVLYGCFKFVLMSFFVLGLVIFKWRYDRMKCKIIWNCKK